MDLLALVRQLMTDGTVETIARNPLAQFGPPSRQYLGATLLPERLVRSNSYRERNIRYRTVVANAGTRYSPTQLKDDNTMVGSMLVELGNSDIARQFTAEDYDAFLDLLANNQSMDAIVQLIRWLDITINRALLDHNEINRWNAMLDASVVLTGDNGFTETIGYSNPAGHRVNAGGTWSNPAYDPYPDIIAMVQLLTNKGFTVGRIITARKIATILTSNPKMAARTPMRIQMTVGTNQAVGTNRPIISISDVNAVFANDGVPPMELYEGQYFDYAGAHRFFRDTSMMFVATTGRDEVISEAQYYQGVVDPNVENVLGYMAMGRAAGQATPGRVIRMEPFDNKPPRIEAEGWQTSLPVIVEPEAIGVINAIG